MNANPDLDILKRSLAEHGWLHIPNLARHADLSAISSLVDQLWSDRPGHVTVDDVDLLLRCRMKTLTPDQRSHRTKIGDLYLWYDEIRRVLLAPQLVTIVAAVFGEPPVLCNSLNLERGSEQDYHSDSLFMTPLTQGRLIACWVALEDAQPDAGPLRLYPASHLIAPYRFSNGKYHVVETELPMWAEYMQREIDTRGLQSRSICAKAGDVIIWHGDTIHGAEPIGNPSLTRKSLVGHFFPLSDSLRRGYRINKFGEAWWVRRRPQPTDILSRAGCFIERRIQQARAAARYWPA